MFIKIASQIADRLEEVGIIDSENKSLYSYGLRQGFTIILNLTTTIVLGCIFDKILQAILFTALYMPLRRFAGGYHAKTAMRCYINSTLLITLVLLLSQFLEPHFWILIILSVLSSVTVALLSPVEDSHKPLDDTERSVYRKKAIITLCLELSIVLLSVLNNVNSLLVIATLNLLVVSLLQIAGKFKNMKAKSNEIQLK